MIVQTYLHEKWHYYHFHNSVQMTSNKKFRPNKYVFPTQNTQNPSIYRRNKYCRTFDSYACTRDNKVMSLFYLLWIHLFDRITRSQFLNGSGLLINWFERRFRPINFRSIQEILKETWLPERQSVCLVRHKIELTANISWKQKITEKRNDFRNIV